MLVSVIADNIISPLGTTTEENFRQLLAGETGIQLHDSYTIHTQPFYASLISNSFTDKHAVAYTRFERMVIQSISATLSKCSVDITATSTGMVLATTKGNIGLLDEKNYPANKLPLHYSASLVAAHFGNPNEPLLVSNACISGLSALIAGKRMIESGKYKHVVVTGADIITKFVFSGFTAFQAISARPCMPYDANRSGVTLGEAAATIILSAEAPGQIKIAGTAGTNDANHISGPSRTGLELSMAMNRALQNAGITPADVDFISAHGTATLYNDEMEAKAITSAKLSQVPVNSLKGYFGHTLGAAGILETVIAVQCMKAGVVLPTKGFNTPGVSEPIMVSNQVFKKKINHCLKTASGFGGCNAAIVLSV